MVAPVVPPSVPLSGKSSWAFAVSLVLAFAGLVRAETLIDPTRSPLGTGPAAAEAATKTGEPATAPQPTRVQMIVRGPGETRTALIDGNNVRVGDTVRLRSGSARVERITDTSVVLARGAHRETLPLLLPGIERSVSCARQPDSQRPNGC
jgi:hypothetical protein